MSGVFGLVDPHMKLDARTTVDKMVNSMSHREWYTSDYYIDEERNLAIGRLGIGIFNQNPQPLVNRRENIFLFIAGEIYNLTELGKTSVEQADEAFILELYESHGCEIFQRLNGNFVIAIWDKRKACLILVTDRFGTYPVYYYWNREQFLFSPEVKGIFIDQSITKNLDQVALAQYMRFQHLLGDRTFFTDIKRVPQATILEYSLSDGQIRWSQYWDYSRIPYLPDITFNEAVEETGRLFRTTVKKLSEGALRPGVYLSGGLDSRSILGMVESRPIVSLTYGHENCRDVHYAKRIAAACGSDHYWFNLPNGNWILENADFHLELTEGFQSWIHAHGISTLGKARELIDVNLSGWDGGAVMGGYDTLDPLQIAPVDDIAFNIRVFSTFNQEYTWPSITEAEERYLYTSDRYQQLRGLAIDSLLEEIKKFGNYRGDMRSEYFYFSNHLQQLTLYSIVFMRSHFDVRLPFLDYDFLSFVFSLPGKIRGAKRLFMAMIQRELPKLAMIPYDKDGFLPTSNQFVRNSHALYVKANRRLNKFLFPSKKDRFTLYADYENYLRTDLRRWAEGILFRNEVGERNIFNVDFIKSIFARHMSGNEMWTIGKIAPILTYEMMLKRFYD